MTPKLFLTEPSPLYLYKFLYWGLGARLFAEDTLEPHSSSSLLVSSLCTITSMKHKLSFLSPVAVAIASSSSSSVATYKSPEYFVSTSQSEYSLRSKSLAVVTQFSHLASPTFACPVVDGINNSSIVPVLDHIVWPIMNLYLDSISTIVDEENDAPLPLADHRRYILSCDLKIYTHRRINRTEHANEN